jgi:hypothetical protein
MEKKTITQVFLLIVLLIISFLIFEKYYVKIENPKNLKENKANNEELKSTTEGKNLIQNIKYSSNNNRGDIYQIISEYGETYSDNPDLMFLTNVTANVIFLSKDDIQVTSNFANFNTKTFETTFIRNVKVTRQDEIITGNELYLILDREIKEEEKGLKLDENLIRMSENVNYKKPGYNLKADILEIDLITKNIKIHMNNKIKKVIAKTIIK